MVWSAISKIGSALASPTGVGAAIGAGASLIGDIATARMSAEEAQRNREFQERMSSTAHQRAAEDLKKAGLNRILAFGSPASTPGGAVGQVPSFGQSLSAGASAARPIAEGEARIDKLVEEAGIIGTKAQRDAMKTDAWLLIVPHLLNAGKQAEKFFLSLNESGELGKLIDEMRALPASLEKEIKKMVHKMLPDIEDVPGMVIRNTPAYRLFDFAADQWEDIRVGAEKSRFQRGH